ncbi:hypothetical protein C8J56DRAFT_33678 [Mycena floridula]|nr:hypothetical protein C8J56DRAFT_33678 [Mycena floridula]
MASTNFTFSSLLCCRHCRNLYLDEIPVPVTREFPDSRTNNAPKAADIASIQADLDVRQAEIQALDDQIALLYRTKRVLESRRTVAYEAMWKNKGILHPIRLVPVELLREIFQNCMASRRGEDFDELRSPGNLAAVSQLWREISISNPELWTTIAVGYRPRMRGAMLRTFLSRSTPRALLDINIGPDRSQAATLNTLVLSSNRWKTLNLELDRFGRFLSPVQDHLKSLTELCIRFPAEVCYEHVTNFRVAPLLRKVEFIYEHEPLRDHMFPDVALPWTTITDWTVKSKFDLPVQLGPLVACQSLTVLQLDRVVYSSSYPIRGVITLPRLSTLWVEASAEDAGAAFLHKIIAPALQSLHLRILASNPRRKADFDIMAVTSLVHRSQCSLVDMRFLNMVFTRSVFINFLYSSPTITHFVFYDDDIDDAILNITPGTSELLPNLTHLGIGALDNRRHIATLLQMLESRFAPTQHAIAKLTAATINIECNLEASELSRLEALRSAGLALSILNHNCRNPKFTDF